jgi:hypothetical protein
MDPTLRKKMVVCTPLGKYVNGEYKGVMTTARLKKIADNFKKYPRQVPIYALGDHVESTDERMPDGWVEGVSVSEAGELVADVKLMGPAAAWVMNDQIRGASIGTVQGKNPDGSTQGEVLQHLLLTNNPFDKSLNIAASQTKGGEAVECFFTALPSTEADMADEKDTEIARLREENAALKAQTADEKVSAELTETQALLQEQRRANAELVASNENLKADVEKFKSPKAIEELNKKLQMQDRQLRAEKIRRLVKDGVSTGRFSRQLVGDPKLGYSHPSDEIVLSWFKDSAAFKGSFERLEIMLETLPPINRRDYGTDAGAAEPHSTAFDASQEEYIRSQGLDPEKVKAAMKAKDAGQYAAAVAAKE